MQHDALSDWDIQALVDGELDPQRAESVLVGVRASPTLWRRYQQLLEQKRLLQTWATVTRPQHRRD